MCSNATVTITVNPINDAPVALADAASTAEDTPLTGTSLLTNDSDVDGNPLTINTTPAVNPGQGTVVINTNGTYTYTPNANYNGPDSFTYQICDNGTPVLCATAVVSITVTNTFPLEVTKVATEKLSGINYNTYLVKLNYIIPIALSTKLVSINFSVSAGTLRNDVGNVNWNYAFRVR